MDLINAKLNVWNATALVPSRIGGQVRCPCPAIQGIQIFPHTHRVAQVKVGLGPTVGTFYLQRTEPADGPVKLVPIHEVTDWEKAVADYQEPIQRWAESKPAAEDSGKGAWRARMLVSADGPSVMLHRKLNSYVTLVLWSDPASGTWSFFIQADPRWFVPQKREAEGSRIPYLKEAIKAALEHAQSIVAQACVLRDTGRRIHNDAAYALTHPGAPVKQPREAGAIKRKAPKAPKDDHPSAPPLAVIKDRVKQAQAAGQKVGLVLLKGVVMDGSTTLVKFRDDAQAATSLRAAGLTEQAGIWSTTERSVPPTTPKPIATRKPKAPTRDQPVKEEARTDEDDAKLQALFKSAVASALGA